MGEFRGEEYHTHAGREMTCLVQEVQVVDHGRIRASGPRARVPGRIPPDEPAETFNRWSLARRNVLTAGMISFFHAEDDGYRAVFINSISHGEMRVTRLELRGPQTDLRVETQGDEITWNTMEVNSQESLESLGNLARWEGPIVLVAVTTAAALIVGFGPAAAVAGLGAPAATSTLTINILNAALSNALTTFIHANYQQMFDARQTGQVATFWETHRYSFGDTLRQAIISGATAAVTAGVFRTPDGEVGFRGLVGYLLTRVGNAITHILNTVITEVTRPDAAPPPAVIQRRITNDLIINLTLRLLG